MSLWGICGLTLLAASLLLFLREVGGRLVPLGVMAAGTVLFTFLLGRYATLFSFLRELPGGETVSEAVTLSFRVLGLSFLTETSAGMCRDLGEGGLAIRLEWCGRAEILLVCLPLLSRMTEAALALLAG
ncbi:MAG: hypothetical protein J6T24_03435 [Clostridia bacterium]|nr:hypothetical protein [Clostridia bacterium]